MTQNAELSSGMKWRVTYRHAGHLKNSFLPVNLLGWRRDRSPAICAWEAGRQQSRHLILFSQTGNQKDTLLIFPSIHPSSVFNKCSDRSIERLLPALLENNDSTNDRLTGVGALEFYTSVLKGAWKCNFPAFLGNNYRPTDQRTKQQTNRPTNRRT